MRLFVSLDLPEPARRLLADWRPPIAGARWTPPERLHLTLRFLGETADDLRVAITESLARIESPAVPVQGSGLLRLPSARRPRVLAARVEESPELAALARRVEVALGRAGVPAAERDLLPHVTLARLKRPDAAALRRVLREDSPPSLRAVSPSLSLVRSEPGPDGSRYTALLTVPLSSG